MAEHALIIEKETGTYIRTGAAYKLYTENKITNFDIMKKVIACDIIEIGRERPPCRNNSNDTKLIFEIKRQLFDYEIEQTIDNELSALLLAIFDFGYMRGAKAEKVKEKANKQRLKHVYRFQV